MFHFLSLSFVSHAKLTLAAFFQKIEDLNPLTPEVISRQATINIGKTLLGKKGVELREQLNGLVLVQPCMQSLLDIFSMRKEILHS